MMPWPFSRNGAAFIRVEVTNSDGNRINYSNNGEFLEKGCHLKFTAITGVKGDFVVKWQITNTGDEAARNDCLRGGFYDSDINRLTRTETTQYSGTHSVQCFIIKKSVCVAKSDLYIVNVI